MKKETIITLRKQNTSCSTCSDADLKQNYNHKINQCSIKIWKLNIFFLISHATYVYVTEHVTQATIKRPNIVRTVTFAVTTGNPIVMVTVGE